MIPFDVYPLLDIEPVAAKGCTVFDKNNVPYLDLYGGHAVISIGHTHPHYVAAVKQQLDKIGFYSNAVLNSLQTAYATKLGELSGYTDHSLFLCNSGAEANENAIKLASFHTGKSKVLTFKGAFHGRTSGAVAVTDNPSYSAPFNQGQAVHFVPLNDIDAVRAELKSGTYCAVIIEGIQGVSGIHLASIPFLKALREACTEYGVALILDEIQSGCGRTGRYFYHQHADIKADLVTLAKGIGNGFPMAALMVGPQFEPVKFRLGTTFGGAHLACAAGLAVVEVMQTEHLIENAATVGAYLMTELAKFPQIKDLRGMGLMIGIEMHEPVGALRNDLLFKHHVFTGAASTNIIRLLPPLCLTKQEADVFLVAFNTLIKK